MSIFLISILLAGTLSFRALPLEDTGLNVATICQDASGNMWYGGIDGLIQYDGKRYFHFKDSALPEASDPDSHIYRLLCNSNGSVWAAHINGLSVFDTGSQSFSSFPSPGGSLTGLVQMTGQTYLLIAGRQLWLFDYVKKGFSREGIPEELLAKEVSALYDENGTIYIGTADGTVYSAIQQLRRLQVVARIGCRVNCILRDGDRLWAGTEGDGLWEISGTPRKVGTRSTDYVKCLCLDRNGLLWVGTKNGLKILEDGKFRVFHYEYYKPDSISHDSICDIFMDRQGTMWLGTYYGGVCYYTPNSSQFQSIASKPGTNELSGNVISDIVEDADGSLWIGTNSGGLNHLLPDGRFEHIGSEGGNPVDVKCIYKSPRTGKLYVGADRSEILLLDSRRKSLKPLGAGGPHSGYGCYAIVDNLRGGFYAGGSDGLWEYNEKDGHFSKIFITEDVSNIKSMKLDSRETLWIGKKYGVTALETKTGKVLALPDLLSSIQYVDSFLEDTSGRIWMSSNSGVYVYDPVTGTIDQFTEKDGLPDHVVHGIEQDSAGVLWISTDDGLCRLDPSDGSTWTFTTADGLLDNRFTPYAHCRKRDGRIYFGSLHGIISFDPLAVTMHSEMVPPVISSIEINGVRRSITEDRIVLKPTERDIAFLFSCPDYISGDNGRFYHMLEGADANWIPSGKDRRAVYHSLRPGEYTFRLRYCNSTGVSSDGEAMLSVRLRAPWYMTYAARTGAVLLLVCLMIVLFVWQLNRKETEYKARMAKAHSALLRELSLEFVSIGANRAGGQEAGVTRNFNDSDEDFMRQAMKVAKKNIDNPDFSIDDFATAMLMSRSNLNLRIKALFGVSPLDFVKTVRFNEACRLLKEDKYNVAEISYRVGFSTPSYFTAAFKQFMGCTPREWIKKDRKG